MNTMYNKTFVVCYPFAGAFKVIGGPGAPTASEGATKTEKKKNGMFSGFID